MVATKTDEDDTAEELDMVLVPEDDGACEELDLRALDELFFEELDPAVACDELEPGTVAESDELDTDELDTAALETASSEDELAQMPVQATSISSGSLREISEQEKRKNAVETNTNLKVEVRG